MAKTVHYDLELLRSRANEVRKYAASRVDAVDRLTNLVNTLPDIWEGKAEQKFAAEFKELANSFNQYDDKLEEFAKALEVAADRMETADKLLLKRVNAIG